MIWLLTIVAGACVSPSPMASAVPTPHGASHPAIGCWRLRAPAGEGRFIDTVAYVRMTAAPARTMRDATQRYVLGIGRGVPPAVRPTSAFWTPHDWLDNVGLSWHAETMGFGVSAHISADSLVGTGYDLSELRPGVVPFRVTGVRMRCTDVGL